jgi:hypothetical protein
VFVYDRSSSGNKSAEMTAVSISSGASVPLVSSFCALMSSFVVVNDAF